MDQWIKVRLVGLMLACLGCAVQSETPKALAQSPSPQENRRWTADVSDPSAMRFWRTNGKYTVNKAGPTDEHVRPGHTTYKLDVTLDESTGPDSYVYWIVPLSRPIPASQGRLQAHISYRIDPATTAEIEFGGMFSIHSDTKILHSGNINIWAIDQNQKGQWQTLDYDAILAGRYTARQVLRKHQKYLTEDDVGTYLEGILIQFKRRQNASHAVIYIDEVNLTGEIPSQDSYRQFVRTKWINIGKSNEMKWSHWESTIKQASEEVQRQLFRPTDPPAAVAYGQGVLKRLKSIGGLVQESRKRGVINQNDVAGIDSPLDAIDGMIASLPRVTDWLQSHRDYRRYVVAPISEYQYLPSDNYPLAALGGEIQITGARSQVVPASVVLATDVERQKIALRMSSLRSQSGEIDASHTQVRVVKCWYQSGTSWQDISQGSSRTLVPELLLYDDALVRVDDQKQTDFLRLDRQSGEEYVSVLSAAPSASTAMWNPTPAEYPVRDAATLVPRPLPAGTSRQFWITVSIPSDAASGSYTGRVEVLSDDQIIDTIPVTLTVLPFELAPSPLEYSIYYRGRLSAGHPEGTVSSDYKSQTQLLDDFKDMVAHGVTNPTVYQSGPSSGPDAQQLLDRYLALRTEAGMSNEVLYMLTSASSPRARLEKDIAFLRSRGVKTVYCYGKDEAFGPMLLAQRAAWQGVHELGAKIFGAGTEENLRVMGDLQDLQVNAGKLSRELADGWHAHGGKLFSYSNPQVGAENPVVYRRNFGLRLWLHGYDGAMNYAYQHAMGNIWDDADHPTYRDHVFAYPTANGLVGTLAWEGFREGATDVRYLATLQAAIQQAESSGSDKRGALASQAKQWLQAIDDTDLLIEDLESVRQQMIQWIISLQP